MIMPTKHSIIGNMRNTLFHKGYFLPIYVEYLGMRHIGEDMFETIEKSPSGTSKDRLENSEESNWNIVL